MTETNSSPSQPASRATIDAQLRGELLAVLTDWLRTGRVLLSAEHFHQAIREAYVLVRGDEPADEVAQALEEMIATINQEAPETLVVAGVENWVVQAIMAEVKSRGWGITEVQENGQSLIRDFIRQPKTRALFEHLGINPQQVNLRHCLRTVAHQVAGKPDVQRSQSAARLQQLVAAMEKRRTAAPAAALEALLSGPSAPPSEAEIEARRAAQQAEHAKLRQQQMTHLLRNLDSYVAQGRLSAEDAQRLRELNRVDEAQRAGKISQERGNKIRNTLLSGQARDQVARKLRDTVDYVVIYQQVFQALKRIDPGYDDALRFLIRHKSVVNAAQRDQADWTGITEELIERLDVLHRLIEVMDRKDAEVRMIAARLPPYSQIMRRGQDRVDNLVIEERFLEDLRRLSPAGLSQRLNATEKAVRVHMAAAILSLCGLIARAYKPTPFRKQLRVLKVGLIIEELYRRTEDVEQARAEAQEFLRTRMRSLFPDLTQEETAEIEQRGVELIERAEQKVLAERQAAPTQRGVQDDREGQADGDPTQAAATLTEEEAAAGAVLGRVAVRTAAGVRQVPYHILPDDDEPGRFVLAKRDRETGELRPALRQGSKRYVRRNRNGVWERC